MARTYEGRATVQFMPGRRISPDAVMDGVFLLPSKLIAGFARATIDIDDTTISIVSEGDDSWLLSHDHVVAIRGTGFKWTNPVLSSPGCPVQMQIPEDM